MTPEETKRVETRLRALRGCLRHPGFKGIMLMRQEIEDIIRAFDAGWKYVPAKATID